MSRSILHGLLCVFLEVIGNKFRRGEQEAQEIELLKKRPMKATYGPQVELHHVDDDRRREGEALRKIMDILTKCGTMILIYGSYNSFIEVIREGVRVHDAEDSKCGVIEGSNGMSFD